MQTKIRITIEYKEGFQEKFCKAVCKERKEKNVKHLYTADKTLQAKLLLNDRI